MAWKHTSKELSESAYGHSISNKRNPIRKFSTALVSSNGLLRFPPALVMPARLTLRDPISRELVQLCSNTGKDFVSIVWIARCQRQATKTETTGFMALKRIGPRVAELRTSELPGTAPLWADMRKCQSGRRKNKNARRRRVDYHVFDWEAWAFVLRVYKHVARYGRRIRFPEHDTLHVHLVVVTLWKKVPCMLLR